MSHHAILVTGPCPEPRNLELPAPDSPPSLLYTEPARLLEKSGDVLTVWVLARLEEYGEESYDTIFCRVARTAFLIFTSYSAIQKPDDRIVQHLPRARNLRPIINSPHLIVGLPLVFSVLVR